jgi:hypothetical protein
MKIREMIKQDLKQQVPLGLLMQYHEEINNWMNNGSFHWVINANSIKHFRQNYGELCVNTIQQIGEINKRYFETNELGEFSRDEAGKPKLKPNVKSELYDEEVKAILDKKVDFNM